MTILWQHIGLMTTVLKMQESIRKNLLDTALQHIPFEGWNSSMLANASVSAGYHQRMGDMIFPGGLRELFEYYISFLDDMMLDSYRMINCQDYKTHHRIRLCLITRLEAIAKHKNVLSRSIAFLALPTNYALAIKTIARTVDLIWYEAGHDKSTDWNYYTKRITLASIYSSTLLFFSSDNSENYSETIAFLDRRLLDIKNINDIKTKLTKFFA